MISAAPIINVDITYTDDTVSSVYVTFVDQTEATYDSAADINAVFQRLADQQAAYTQGTSA